MLTKPDLRDEGIYACLRDSYGLEVIAITFLPLGADFNTAVYSIAATNRMRYFLKLRRGEFSEASVTVPSYLARLGVKEIISPIPTNTGQLWASLDAYKAILYPYIEGSNGIETILSDKQWIELGSIIRGLHQAEIPSSLLKNVVKEEFSPKYRNCLKAFLKNLEKEIYVDAIATEMALFLRLKRDEINKLIDRAEHLAVELQRQSLEFCLCHADIHGWNLLIDKSNALYLVDWDALVLAPKERDLMFIGAGIWESGRTPSEEESLFYQGYRPVPINHDAIAYYRYERILVDIYEYCEQMLLPKNEEGADDKEQSLHYLQANFLPKGTIERAYDADKSLI